MPAVSSPQLSLAHSLAHYIDVHGHARELIAQAGHAGSVLVLDRDAATLRDRRLVAHLAADEPPENAQLVCDLYLADAHGRWCRALEPADLEVAPLRAPVSEACRERPDGRATVVDRYGNAYRIRAIPGARSGLQLRWTCRDAHGTAWRHVSLREAVACVESYEPMRTLTQQALADVRSERPSSISCARLEVELERLASSPIVLNRGLREAVLETIRMRGVSMSEVASRCGMVKCDRRGRLSGETSWLARRVGLMPEGGGRTATPWVHSDVLGLIARKGLGMSPREVEL
jgi:hypothetical protein